MVEQSNFSTRNREFDYLQLHWLEKTTGRPSHEWDLYIIKELLDNALDADELWSYNQGNNVQIVVDIYYRHNEAKRIHALEIAVYNQAPFPLGFDLLTVLFDLTAYTSNKSHTNYPSRGRQGNALKTLLGMPYALRHFGRGDYSAIRKPLVIETGVQAVVVNLEIDEVTQTVQLAPLQATTLREPHNGTCIRVGIDYFKQERPRTLADLQGWAQRFALFNPHATFVWQVRMDNQAAQWRFEHDPAWHNLFIDTSPVHWYEYSQLRDLLLALQRKLGPEASLATALQTFAGFTPQEDPNGDKAEAFCKQRGFRTLGDLHLADEHSHTLRNVLWPALQRLGRVVPATALGNLGGAYLAEQLSKFHALVQPPLYRCVVHDDPQDPTHPFVLELVVARLPTGQKRQIWTGINHTPSYEDPFYQYAFYPTIKGNESVFGLDGFLDAYGQIIDQPVLLLFHLSCPNLPFQDFAKTKVDVHPFRTELTRLLDEMLTEFTRVERVEIEELETPVHALLSQVIDHLSPDNHQHYTASQLLRGIRNQLITTMEQSGRGEFITAWLADPGANTHIQNYLRTYAQQHPNGFNNLIQPERGILVLPVHSHDYTTVALSRLDLAQLDELYVNKLLLVDDTELEELLIANNLLTRFDMALLRSEGDLRITFAALLPHLPRLHLPLVLLHHARARDFQLLADLSAQLNTPELNHVQLLDLGLTPAQGRNLGLAVEVGTGGDRATLAQLLSADEVAFLVDERHEYSLFGLTAQQLEIWLEERFVEVELSPKLVPTEKDLRAKAITTIREQLASWVIERFHVVYEVPLLVDHVMLALKDELQPNNLLEQLHSQLDQEPNQAWLTVWQKLVADACQTKLQRHVDQLDQWIADHGPNIYER